MATPTRTPTACLCFITPPYLLEQVVRDGSGEQRAAAARTLLASSALRARRATAAHLLAIGATSEDVAHTGAKQEHLAVYDAHNGTQLPGQLVRSKAGKQSSDTAVNEAWNGADTTYRFYETIFGRNSVDDHGLKLVSSVHYDVDFDNAFWDGSQMVYGDGSGQLFVKGGMTKDLDVMAHELTHGVTQYTANLAYETQSGALNESMSDVFGSMAKQWSLGQTADQADWLIGAGIEGPALPGNALRSMSKPGTAYTGDPQPADMAHYANLPNDARHDNGGVHINSGIPNRAFYLAATGIGGHSWEKAGQIWYDVLTGPDITSTAQFADVARLTVAAANKRFGGGSAEEQAVTAAWQQVGVLTANG